MIATAWDPSLLEDIAAREGWIVHATREIPSTNTALLTLARHQSIHRHWFIADHQNQGRGRQHKTWHSVPGHTLVNSFGWTFPQPLHRVAQGASLVTGLCVVRALSAYTHEARLKWPNDILLYGKKLAGLLIEVAHHTPQETTLVIGLGLNWVRPLTNSDDTSLSIGLNHACPAFTQNDQYALLGTLLHTLDHDLKCFGADGFAPFRYDWNHYHAWEVGTPVSWQDNEGFHEGFLESLDEYGRLWVTRSTGQRTLLGEQAYSLRSRKELL